MNVILVVFDTLRKDCLGLYGAPPWYPVQTPHLDAFAAESVTYTRFYPESLPTLPARRAFYTGQRVYPYRSADEPYKGDTVTLPGWGPMLESQDTVAELLQAQGYRTALISDLYHQFKPSKNFGRGFDQWMFLRGQERDPYRSGPEPTQTEIDYWLPKEIQALSPQRVPYMRQALMNMYRRQHEEDYFNARVMIEASRWLEQNQDAENFFLVAESFDPHEPWFVPSYYRQMYDTTEGREMVASPYMHTDHIPDDLIRRVQANYSGLVTMCDRWFGHLYETIRTLGLLDNTVIIVTSDHGHALGDTYFVGKRGYPSHPNCLDTILLIRHPDPTHAGRRSDVWAQPTDVAAQILDFAGGSPNQPLDGRPFFAGNADVAARDHVTVGWGTAVTVIDQRWWFNGKVDGTGLFLHDLQTDHPFETNVADENPNIVNALYARAVADAGGSFPAYLVDLAHTVADAPGCSAHVIT